MKKFLLAGLMSLVLAAGASAAVVDTAAVYMPFENTNGDPYDSANPAWENVVAGDTVNWISPGGKPAYPQIASNGVKGDCWYGTDSAMDGLSAATHNWTGGSVKTALDGVNSYTICGWVNTRDAAKGGSNSFILGSKIPVKWLSDGRLQLGTRCNPVQPGISWAYMDWHTGNSKGAWKFLAITRDSNSIKFYAGDATTPVAAAGQTDYVVPLTATDTTNRIVIGGYTYNGSDKNCNFDMDELRIFSAADGSGALPMCDLEEIRQFDLIPEPATMLLLGLGGVLGLRRKR